MKNTMNLNEMSLNELIDSYKEYLAQGYAYLEAIASKREEEMKKAIRSYKETMANLGLSEAQMKTCIDADDATVASIIWDVSLPTIPEILDNSQDDEKEPLVLPEPTWEMGDVTLVEEEGSINRENNEEEENKVETASIWDNPALTAPYNPMTAKKSEASAAPEKTPVENSDEELSSLEDLLSDDPEYKAFYHPATPVKKNNRSLPTLDELLSDDPINKILCLGNEKEKGSPYRQHTRINHADGIIPTETATGKTMVYIPPAPPVAS